MSERRNRMSPWIQGYRAALAILTMVSLIGGLLEAVFLVLVTRAAFAITDGRPRFGVLAGHFLTVRWAVLLALALVVARAVLGVAGNSLAARINAKSISQFRKRMGSAFLNAPWSVQQRDRSGRLQEMMGQFAHTGAQLISSLGGAIIAGANLVAMLGLAVLVDPTSSILTAGAVIVLGGAMVPLRKAMRRYAARAAASGMEFATSLSEVSQLGLEMHVFNVQGEIGQGLNQLIEKDEITSEQVSRIRGLVPVLYAGLAYLALIGGLAFASASPTTKLTSLGAVMLVMLRSLSYGQNLQLAIAGMASVRPYLDTFTEQIERYEESVATDQGNPIGRVGHLSLVDVSFEYESGQPVLHRISATIEPGEIIGVVGPSGSGKSTLVQLLLRLREPSSGSVLAEGREIGSLSHADWARHVTFVPQQAHLVRGTVRDNIRFFRSDVTEERIVAAAKSAHLHDEIMAFPEGYDREVGERGGALSGGQQQRLCIARALVEDPDVLILDEPTSALDPRSESLIRSTLAGLGDEVSVVIIAHRLSTLDICDRIMVIQDGHLKAFDRPDVLAQQSDFYREALMLSGIA